MIDEMDDLSMMQDSSSWPSYPYLPVKRYVGDSLEFGFMTCEHEPTIYKGNLFDSESRMNLDKLKVYASYGELLADGWMVD